MTNITAEILIKNDRRLTVDLQLPPDCPTGRPPLPRVWPRTLTKAPLISGSSQAVQELA